VTYLWEGAMMHRDSLGCVQEVLPGDVNWMIAGRGIVHSERTPERLVGKPHPVHGLQTWVALPHEHEEHEPAFTHHPKATLPVVEQDGATLTIVAGHGFGARSPVAVLSTTLYVSIELRAGASLQIPAEHVERALYPVLGELTLDDVALARNTLALLDPATTPVLRAVSDARVMLVGGAPLDGPRIVWWNFVSSSQERIEQGKADWRAGRFSAVPGETEFIPLPEQ
jgi:redox-sensitive bicupin YhaK (pirin superfamily)